MSQKEYLNLIILSIVVVTKNNTDDLIATLKSVKGLKDSEIIIVDGSSFASLEKLDLVKDTTGDQFNYLRGPDKGIYDGMNKGLAMAKGVYVYFLNSGDTYIYNQNLINFLHAANYFKIKWIIGGQSPKTRIGIEFMWIWSRLLILGIKPLPHQSTFMARETLNELGGFNTNLKIYADQELFFRALTRNMKPVMFKEIISKRKIGGLGDQQKPGTFALQMNETARQLKSWNSSSFTFIRFLVYFLRKMRTI